MISQKDSKQVSMDSTSLLRIAALNVARNEAWVASEALCSLRWCVGVYSIFMESCIINF